MNYNGFAVTVPQIITKLDDFAQTNHEDIDTLSTGLSSATQIMVNLLSHNYPFVQVKSSSSNILETSTIPEIDAMSVGDIIILQVTPTDSCYINSGILQTPKTIQFSSSLDASKRFLAMFSEDFYILQKGSQLRLFMPMTFVLKRLV